MFPKLNKKIAKNYLFKAYCYEIKKHFCNNSTKEERLFIDSIAFVLIVVKSSMVRGVC